VSEQMSQWVDSKSKWTCSPKWAVFTQHDSTTIHRLSASSKSRRRMVLWRRCKQANLSYYFPLKFPRICKQSEIRHTIHLFWQTPN